VALDRCAGGRQPGVAGCWDQPAPFLFSEVMDLAVQVDGDQSLAAWADELSPRLMDQRR
jgi:hypothetical protein